MARLFVVALFAAFSASVHAESSDRWFIDGVAWYQHPCGIPAFAKYGSDTRAQVRRNYEVTQHNPEMCRRLFP